MKKTSLLAIAIVAAAASISIAAKPYYRCYEYDSSLIKLKPGYYAGRLVLALPPRISAGNHVYLLLTDSSGTKIGLMQPLSCDRKDGAFLCRDEDGSGRLHLDRRMRLTLDAEAPITVNCPSAGVCLLAGDDAKASNGCSDDCEAKISPVSEKKKIPGKHIVCPAVVSALYDPRRDKSPEKTEHRFVCYDHKTVSAEKVKYTGCAMSPVRCERLGKSNFGQYRSLRETESALIRCNHAGSEKK